MKLKSEHTVYLYIKQSSTLVATPSYTETESQKSHKEVKIQNTQPYTVYVHLSSLRSAGNLTEEESESGYCPEGMKNTKKTKLSKIGSKHM